MFYKDGFINLKVLFTVSDPRCNRSFRFESSSSPLLSSPLRSPLAHGVPSPSRLVPLLRGSACSSLPTTGAAPPPHTPPPKKPAEASESGQDDRRREGEAVRQRPRQAPQPRQAGGTRSPRSKFPSDLHTHGRPGSVLVM